MSLVNGRSPALASADIWNAVVDAETRNDARYARENAYAMTVTAENVDAIKDRLGAGATFYESQCLIPPHKGIPGIAKPSEEEAVLLGAKVSGCLTRKLQA